MFGAGTVQWAWGLDANHDRGSAAADVRMQQATVNLFADMGAQPATLQSGLVAATRVRRRRGADLGHHVAGQRRRVTPGSRSRSAARRPTPAAARSAASRSPPTAARPGGARTAAPRGRSRGRPARSRATRIRSRAVDDSGNLESPGAGVTVTAGSGNSACPCSIWGPTATPAKAAETTDTAPIEVGTRFRSDAPGGSAASASSRARRTPAPMSGTSSAGPARCSRPRRSRTRRRAAGRRSASAHPVEIAADTTYVASYHAPRGNYASNVDFFTLAGVDNGPLRALADGEDGRQRRLRVRRERQLPQRDLALGELLGRRGLRDGRRGARHHAAHHHRRDARARRGDVALGANVTAQFNEALTPATVNTHERRAARRRRARSSPPPSATTPARGPRRSTRPPR